MTSGMVALVPTDADAGRLAVDDGEDPGQLHLTLAYLGDRAVDMPAESRDALHQVVSHMAAETPPVAARVAGHLLFNPDGGPDGDRTPCAAYLVSDSPDIMPLRDAVTAASGALLPDTEQHEPFIPHITGVYDRDASALHYAGPVRFGALRVAIGPDASDYPLSGSGEDADEDSAAEEAGETPAEEAAEQAGETKPGDREEKAMDVTISVDDLDAAYAVLSEIKAASNSGAAPSGSDDAGNALPDGSYQINHPGQLKTAINALTAYQVDKSKRAALRKHVIKHARRLKAENMVPRSIVDEEDGDAEKRDGGAGGKKNTADEKSLDSDLEIKNRVATQAGVKKYGQPIGTVLGQPRDAAAAEAQKNTDAVNAYKDLLAGHTASVEPLPTMDTAALEDLTRVAYSYKSVDPRVVALRTQLANELARRGLKVTDYGALGTGPAKTGARKKTAAATPTKKAGAGKQGPQVKGIEVDLEFKAKYSAEQRREMAKKGHALPDGSYPIKDKSDLDSAIRLRGRHATYSKAKVAAHIRKRARSLGATDMLPEDMADTAASKGIEEFDLEFKDRYNAAQRREMAKKGQALPNGSYPIADRSDLHAAIRLRNHGKSYSTATVYKHIIKRAQELGAVNMLPRSMSESKALDRLSWDGTGDAFTGGVLLGLAGLDPDEATETKAGPPGATFPSPDPNAARLRKYWTRGKGALKIRWGEHDDFYRCVEQLTKYVGARAKGLCNIYHRVALGVAPGQEDKPGGAAHAVAKMAANTIKSAAEAGDLELKSPMQLWVRDVSAVDGWRAHEPAWMADIDLISEWKAIQRRAAPPGPEEDKEDVDATGGGQDDGDVAAALDRYARMAPEVSAEDAYEQAIAADVPWRLEGSGDLVDPREESGADTSVMNEPDDFGENVTEDQNDSLFDDAGSREANPLDPDGDGDIDENDADENDAGENGAGEDLGTGTDSLDEGEEAANGQPASDLPEVAELLAALMADEENPEVTRPTDDQDAGEAEEDSEATGQQRRPARTGA